MSAPVIITIITAIRITTKPDREGRETFSTNAMAANGNWFCLRSQTKHERIAAAHLKK
jgi:hypothetical protein